jgi:Uncharacterised nucleotidyltransferase
MGESTPPAETELIVATLRKAAAALRDADVPFALAASVAAWARGGPHPSNDLDFAVRREDAERALQTLEAAGMRGERPPEDWLLKAWDGGVMIDLIWDFEGLAPVEELLERAEELSVEAIPMRVLTLEDVLVSRLSAMGEHHLDFAGPLALARALRERIDWDDVRRRTAGSPYAHGFLAMLDALGIVGTPDQGSAGPAPHAQVRVVGGA